MGIQKRLEIGLFVRDVGGEWSNTSNGRVLLLQPTGAAMPNGIDRFPLALYMLLCWATVSLGRRGGLEAHRRVGSVYRPDIERAISTKRDVRSVFSRGGSVNAYARNDDDDGVDR